MGNKPEFLKGHVGGKHYMTFSAKMRLCREWDMVPKMASTEKPIGSERGYVPAESPPLAATRRAVTSACMLRSNFPIGYATALDHV